jgi:catechol 2,3-dioxygenase-like lactoylglutathione lyase family enzyme
MISRRSFLILAGGTAVMPHYSWASDKIPTMLDHILLGCSDLDQGIAFVEHHTGVRPAIGGVHPGRGTRNALLALGQGRYLEVIAPDPAQTAIPTTKAELPAMLKQFAAPQLVAWAVRTLNIEASAERLRRYGVAFQGPTPGSRARPDGEMLHWKTLNFDDDRDGLLPFLIEWGADTPHPSGGAPSGCELESFAVAGPNPRELSAEFERLGIEVEVANGTTPHLRVRIVGPKGEMVLD